MTVDAATENKDTNKNEIPTNEVNKMVEDNKESDTKEQNITTKKETQTEKAEEIQETPFDSQEIYVTNNNAEEDDEVCEEIPFNKS